MPGLESFRYAGPVDELLTGYAVSFRDANEEGAVADFIFPEVPVPRDTGTFNIWSAGNVMRNRSSVWAKGAPTPEMRIRAKSDTFSCKKYGMKTSIDDDDRQNNQSGAALDQEATAAATKTVILDREVRVKNAITALTADLDLSSGTNTQWNEASAAPKQDIDDGKEAIQKATGMLPTDLVMGRAIFRSLRVNAGITGSAAAQLKDDMKAVLAQTAQNVNELIIAQWLDVPMVRVASMVYDAAIEVDTVNDVNTTGTYIWADDMIVYRREETPTTTSISFGKSFTSVPLHITPRWRVEDVEADWIRAKAKWDEKIATRKAGYYIKDVLA